MKLLIITLTMIFISFSTSAVTVGDLYKYCKPYQNNGFEFNNLGTVQIQNALGCMFYLRGMIDRGRGNCIVLEEMNKMNIIETNKLKVFSNLTANDKAPLNPIITSFINYAENNTHQWKYSPLSYAQDFISKKFPCKIKE